MLSGVGCSGGTLSRLLAIDRPCVIKLQPCRCNKSTHLSQAAPLRKQPLDTLQAALNALPPIIAYLIIGLRRATSNINLKRLASWSFVKLRKWLGNNGFSKESIRKCPGKEELLELWRVKKDFESGPKHRNAGDFRSHLVGSKDPLGTASEVWSVHLMGSVAAPEQCEMLQGWDYTDTKSRGARHVHAGDYRVSWLVRWCWRVLSLRACL